MKRKLRDNSLSLTVMTVFVLLLAAHSVAGWKEYNADQAERHQAAVAYPAYLHTGHFMESVFENWESEFLQMAAYVWLTSFLIQRGSAESKNPDEPEPDKNLEEHRGDPDAPGPLRAGGWKLKLYSHSLSLSLIGIFLFSFAGHALGGARLYSQEQVAHGQPPVDVWGYLETSRFWFESMQNWQSEFLAVGSLVLLSIWLREKGSPESKAVFRPHSYTGAE